MAVASADAPPGPYFNGFETNTAGWSPNSGGTIARQPSGYNTGPGGYADGIASADGTFWRYECSTNQNSGTMPGENTARTDG